MGTMREFANMKRYVYFLGAVLVGIGFGLLYGWVVSPIQFYDTTPGTLRVDYQSDYVLMVAEAYTREQDALLAVERLYLLGTVNPAEKVQEAIVFAVQAGYAPEDLAVMRELGEAVRTWNSALDPTLP
jgi:hypothetical protein